MKRRFACIKAIIVIIIIISQAYDDISVKYKLIKCSCGKGSNST